MGTETQCLRTYMELENIPDIAVSAATSYAVKESLGRLFFSASAWLMRHPAAKANKNHLDDFC